MERKTTTFQFHRGRYGMAQELDKAKLDSGGMIFAAGGYIFLIMRYVI